MNKEQVIAKWEDIQKWKITSLVDQTLIGQMLNDVKSIDTDFYFEKGYNQRRLDGNRYDKDLGEDKLSLKEELSETPVITMLDMIIKDLSNYTSYKSMVVDIKNIRTVLFNDWKDRVITSNSEPQEAPTDEEFISLNPGEYMKDENGNIITYEDEQREIKVDMSSEKHNIVGNQPQVSSESDNIGTLKGQIELLEDKGEKDELGFYIRRPNIRRPKVKVDKV